MKKTVFAVMAFSTAFSTYASPNLEEQVLRLSKRVHTVAQRQVDTLSEEQLFKVKKKLKNVLNILKGQTLPPNDGHFVCAEDSADLMHATFKKVKNFAYSSSGLDYTSSGAASFAENFINTQPCSAADTMVSSIKRLKTFAYSSSGLDMTSSASKDYALNKWDTFCADFPIESEFKKHYRFAYSSSGLDLSSSAAKKYAADKIERPAFSCSTNF